MTGGIGSGKSTVAQMLREKGAVVIDADDLARRAVEPGTEAHAAILRRFGKGILAEGGVIDRNALAGLVFTDPEARRDLEQIVHPEVFRSLERRAEPYAGTDRVVVFDAALIFETGFDRACDVIVVVTAPRVNRIERIMAARGTQAEEVESRIAAQVPPEQSARKADITILNEGTMGDLARRVDAVWDELQERAGMIGSS